VVAISSLLQRRILLLVLLRLEKDFCGLLVLLLDLLLQMLFEFLQIIMLHGALVLQELEHLEVHLQNLRQRLPMRLLRTGSPPWAG
jgi:hypothetical protein